MGMMVVIGTGLMIGHMVTHPYNSSQYDNVCGYHGDEGPYCQSDYNRGFDNGYHDNYGQYSNRENMYGYNYNEPTHYGPTNDARSKKNNMGDRQVHAGNDIEPSPSSSQKLKPSSIESEIWASKSEINTSNNYLTKC